MFDPHKLHQLHIHWCPHRGSQRAAVEWRLHKLVMAVNRAYLMSESTADSKYSNNSSEMSLRTYESRSNHKETSIKVLPSVLGPSFPRKSEREHFESTVDALTAMTNLCRRHLLPRAGNPCGCPTLSLFDHWSLSLSGVFILLLSVWKLLPHQWRTACEVLVPGWWIQEKGSVQLILLQRVHNGWTCKTGTDLDRLVPEWKWRGGSDMGASCQGKKRSL